MEAIETKVHHLDDTEQDESEESSPKTMSKPKVKLCKLIFNYSFKQFMMHPQGTAHQTKQKNVFVTFTYPLLVSNLFFCLFLSPFEHKRNL